MTYIANKNDTSVPKSQALIFNKYTKLPKVITFDYFSNFYEYKS